MLTDESFQGRTVLVTGARGGVGRAVVEALESRGAAVLASDLGPRPDRLAAADWAECDLTEQAAVADLADRGRGIGVDSLVHCAGVMAKAPVGAIDWQLWQTSYRVNVQSFVELVEGLLPSLRAAPTGRILAIASMTAGVGLATYAPYSSAKAALVNAVRVLAAELAPTGITANCVSPGWVDTPMTAALFRRMEQLHQLRPGTGRAFVEKLIPQGRLVTSAEVAAAVLFLASPPGGAITGQDLVIDGGLTGCFAPGVHA